MTGARQTSRRRLSSQPSGSDPQTSDVAVQSAQVPEVQSAQVFPAAPTAAEEVPPVRTIVLDRPPAPVAPPLRERNPLREPLRSTAGPERLRLEGREHQLRRQTGRQVGVAVDPPGRGARADRAVGLRQDDAAAHAQPPDRADPERRARRAGAARRRGHPRAGRHDAARAGGDGLPAAQPVSDVDLRQRRLRPARAVAQAPAQARARAAGGRCAAPRRALRGGPRRPRSSRAAPVRRPAAAAVHRPRDRAAARRCC